MADDELLARFLSPERTTLATDIADDSAAGEETINDSNTQPMGMFKPFHSTRYYY